eukprot:TRINITY_DN122060_c0_g1_i1.p1 TRINITY_DN122060_c0_g1~~TRINITY_DN122060_c0_g1_i1.p1  ORF type:complete len:347 (+),score=35.83 TRINITY_DN122060_c0_g1_i1:296-1336(+)
MKILLALLVIVAVCTGCEHCHEEKPGTQIDNNLVNLIKGLMLTINQMGGIDGLKPCIKENFDVFFKIDEALALFTKRDVQTVISGLEALFDGLKLLFNMLKPCMLGYHELMKYYGLVSSNPDTRKIAVRLVLDPHLFFSDALTAANCFKVKNFICVGSNLGYMLKIIFFPYGKMLQDSSLTEKHSLKEASFDFDSVTFIEGFLEGLNEKGDVNKFLKCVKNIEFIVEKIIQAIQHMDPSNLIKDISLLLEAISELLKVLNPCAEGFEQIQRLIDAVAHADIIRLVFNVLASPQKYVQDVIDCVDAFNKSEFHRSGKDLGNILYMLFLINEQLDQHGYSHNFITSFT